MWPRLKAACMHPLTIAWSYCLAFLGASMQGIDSIAEDIGGWRIAKPCRWPLPGWFRRRTCTMRDISPVSVY